MCACVLLFGWNEVTIEIGRILGAAFWDYPGALLLCLGRLWITMWITSAELWITFDVISAVFIEEGADFTD